MNNFADGMLTCVHVLWVMTLFRVSHYLRNMHLVLFCGRKNNCRTWNDFVDLMHLTTCVVFCVDRTFKLSSWFLTLTVFKNNCVVRCSSIWGEW